MALSLGARRSAATAASASILLVVTTSAAAAAPQARAAGQALDRPAVAANCEWLSESARRTTPYCHQRMEAGAEAARGTPQAAEPSGFKFSSFLKYLHTDAFWMPSESGAGLKGLIGVHLVIANVGRLHVFGPPGVMLVAQDTGSGRLVRAARTWGMSYYLIDFRIPGTTRQGKLFANFGKLWTSGDHRTGINMIGLSATWKK